MDFQVITIKVDATGEDAPAALNRNYELNKCSAPIIIMLDDDISGFYDGWEQDLIKPLANKDIALVSARLIDYSGKNAPMMGGEVYSKRGIVDAVRSEYRGYTRVCTAAIAFRNNPVRFDENFIGCGYEDTDWMNRLNEHFAGKRFVINNDCKLIHRNEMKNQGGKYFEHNKAYYLSKWPDDKTVQRQRDWTVAKAHT